ncbi:MAG: PQQ-binding-like beta-propeller repeat protein [Armatimonadota bacterium]
MYQRLLFIVILAICMGGAAYASDWAQFLGPTANSISTEKVANKDWNARPPKMLWQVPMSDDGYAGPSVAEGRVFIIDHIGTQSVVKVLELSTGKEAWKFSYLDDEKPNYGFDRATPVINKGRVYILSRFGRVFCLNVRDGRQIWTRDIKKDFEGKLPIWEYAMSPLIDGNKVILCPGGKGAAMVALDKTTGKTIWQGGGSDIPGYATPQIASINGQKQYVVFTGVSVIGVDPSDGTLIWRYPWKSKYDLNGASLIISGNTVFLTSYEGNGCALLQIDGNKVNLIWETKDLECLFSSPILIDGYIYGVGKPGELVCLDYKNGKSVWRQEGFENGGFIAADGTLIALGGATGILHMVKITPTSYHELGKFTPLGGQSWTAPILSNGNLIIRNKTALACFLLK